MDQIDPKTFDRVAQSAHFFSGVCFGFFPSYFGIGLWPTIFFWLVCFAMKEFWYDEKYEPPAVRGSSLKDFLVQTLGLAVGVGIYVVSS